MTYFLIPFGMRGKMTCFELCFTCTDDASSGWNEHGQLRDWKSNTLIDHIKFQI